MIFQLYIDTSDGRIEILFEENAVFVDDFFEIPAAAVAQFLAEVLIKKLILISAVSRRWIVFMLFVLE